MAKLSKEIDRTPNHFTRIRITQINPHNWSHLDNRNTLLRQLSQLYFLYLHDPPKWLFDYNCLDKEAYKKVCHGARLLLPLSLSFFFFITSPWEAILIVSRAGEHSSE